MNAQSLSDKEIRRYQAQLDIHFIGHAGQEKIKQSKILVVGAGGIGTSVMQQLTAAGIGTIGIADNDLVDEKNIHRQFLYGTTDLGKQKAIVSKQKLYEKNTLTQYKIHNICLSMANIGNVCHEYDLIIDATDFSDSNKLLCDYCFDTKKPMLFGRVNGLIGEVSVFNYHGGPTYIDYEKQFKPENTKQGGYINMVSNIVATYMSAEIIKIIVGCKNILSGMLLRIDIFSNKCEYIPFS